MEEKDADLWWDTILDIVQKDIWKVYKKHERNERLYRLMTSQMEKVIPSSEYEPLVLSPRPETSYEEEDKRNTYGVGPSSTRIVEELGDL